MSNEKDERPLLGRKFVVDLSSNIKEFNYSKEKGMTTYTHGYKVDLNSDGFRSPTFQNKIDLLYAGCSFTFGVGLPQNHTWGSILAKNNNLSYNSIGIPGGSVMDIVFNIFKYFEKYGNPKNLLVLFPDFNRVYTYMDGNILNQKSMNKDEESPVVNMFLNDPGQRIDSETIKFLRLPTSPQNIYSKEYTYMINSMYIKMLETYCNSHSIPFVWFKWCEDSFDLFGGLESFSNNITLESRDEIEQYSLNGLDPSVHEKCHQAEKLELQHLSQVWTKASDYSLKDSNGHNGIHWQIHVKEIFQNVLKLKGLI